MVSEKIIGYARNALPHLIYYAQQRQTVTYKVLAQFSGCHHRVINRVLEYIRDDICASRGYPLLTAIVVNQTTGLPGDSFLPEGTSQLSELEYQKKYETLRDKVFAFPGWDTLLKEMGIPPVATTEKELLERGHTYGEMLSRQKNAIKDEEVHKLKEYVANHPERLGLLTTNKGQVDYQFKSGDICDVLFHFGNNCFAIAEIRNGENVNGLVHGVNQLLKFKALLIKDKRTKDDCLVSIHLVTHQMKNEVRELAKKSGISCHEIFSIPDKGT